MEQLYTHDGEQVPVERSAIRFSEKVDKLLPALLEAQRAIEYAHKDGTNPHFQSTYPTLTSLIDAVKPHYNKANVLIVQGAITTGEPWVEMATRFIECESGQWCETSFGLTPNDGKAHAMTGGSTYCSRYSLRALALVGADDDDGNAAQGKPAKPRKAGGKKKDTDEPTAPDRAKSLKTFHGEWESLVAAVEDGDEADANRNLENVFLWAQTDASTKFNKKTDYMRPLKADRIDGLTAMLKESKADIVGWLESEDVRESVGLPSLSVKTCPGCAEILSPKDKTDSDTVGLDKGYCAKCRPAAVVAMMGERKGAAGEAV